MTATVNASGRAVPAEITKGDRFVLRTWPDDGATEYDGLTVTFSSFVKGSFLGECCVQADPGELAEARLLDSADDGFGIVVPTDWLVPA